MEYCEGGSLQDLINEQKESKTHMPESYVWNVLFQLSSALVYCHLGLLIDSDGNVSASQRNLLDWKRVLHRDIKPANVLLLSRSPDALDSVKLGDFGLGYMLEKNTAPETYAGTAQYLAPEINRRGTRAIYWTEHCDIYSLGCTIYALCTLAPPFDFHRETNIDSYSSLPDQYSPELAKCIGSCLSFYPETRPNALGLLQQSQTHVIHDLPASRQDVKLGNGDCESPQEMTEATNQAELNSKSIHNQQPRPKKTPALRDESKRRTPRVENVLPSLIYSSLNYLRDTLEPASYKEYVNDISGDYPLHRAAFASNLTDLRFSLKEGYPVDRLDSNGKTALIYASACGYRDLVLELLGANVNPNIPDNECGGTALHWAASRGHTGVVETLIEHGADLNIEDYADNTAQDLAAVYYNRDIVRLIHNLAQNRVLTLLPPITEI